jgi:hypothetical protein
MHVGVPGFEEAFFGNVASLKPAAQAVFEKCKEGDIPLFQRENGWQGCSEGAKERDIGGKFGSMYDVCAWELGQPGLGKSHYIAYVTTCITGGLKTHSLNSI